MTNADLLGSKKSEIVDLGEGNHVFAGDGVRGVSFGTAGDLVVIRPDGSTDTFPEGNLAAGGIHPIWCTAIVAELTTAENIVGHY